ncbi:MAG TPA: prolyl oligopeptidase family serine peptidase [Bryobacteraceae bacterium]|nr:prolyl oligopeptidase family serine peptidase [Bryobacteraceae bacterium]
MPQHRILLALLTFVLSMEGAKRPLTSTDADNWRTIQRPTLSRDGRWLAYGLFPQEGDGEFVVRDLRTGKERREAAGALPPPPEPAPDQEPTEVAAPPAIRILFTQDSRFILFSTFPRKADAESAKKAKKDAPKNGLAMMNLTTGDAAHRVVDVKSFQVPERGGSIVAFQKEGEKVPTPAAGRPREEYGSELTIRDLAAGTQRSIPDVLEYLTARDGNTLVYAVRNKDGKGNGAYWLTPGSTAEAKAIAAGTGKFSKLTFDLKQTRLAFLQDGKLMLWSPGGGLEEAHLADLTAGNVISERAPLGFTRDGSRIFLGTAPRPPEQKTDAASERVAAELWHYRDPFVQPMQKVRAAQERNRSYRAVYHIAAKKLVQLADEAMAGILPSDDGRYAIGIDDRAYRSMVDYDRLYSDSYLIDTMTGSRRKLFEKSEGGVYWSPDGERVLFHRAGHWHVLTAATGAVVSVTGTLNVSFVNEEEDRPQQPAPYGTAGWTRDSRDVVLYDRYDIWQVAADGSSARLLTDGVGRKGKMQIRIVRLPGTTDDEEPRGLDPAEPLLLRAENTETRETGLWLDRLDRVAPPQRLVSGPRSYRPLAKAHDADVVLLTTSTFHEYPDLMVTDMQFRRVRKVTDANPQHAQLQWGTGELVHYRSADGVPLTGALYKPEGFDPQRRYPLLVYIYEKLSQNVHNFVDPKPGTSPNISHYVSNGYMVLTPDIVYTTGHPGQSALKCVLPAVDAVVRLGGVDEKAIGIAGHSWGGYQAAYLVSQTRRFRAAEAGAPVGNMISAYNGIRWGTGVPRQFQYERAQSRIGGSLWDYPLLFVENSPIFHVRSIETPLLMIHNDADDAVPWYQGIELYLSLRRNGKEAYLFNYNGEKHGLRHRINQEDWTARMQAFFDHYLKGAPKPAWMEKGIPYLERESGFALPASTSDVP